MAQVWGTASAGGYLYSDILSDFLRMQLLKTVKFRQFCDIEESEAIGKHQGATWRWNLFSKVATKGNRLTEGTVIPNTQFTILQRSASILELGNSINYTSLLDDLSLQPVKQIIRKVLSVDAKEAIDIEVYLQVDGTPLRVGAASGTSTTAVTLETGGASTITNNVAFGKGHVQPIVTIMKERGIPPFINDDYYALSWPSALDNLRDGLEAVHQYVETGLAQLMNGEIGRWRGLRFVEQTHIPKGGAEDSGTFNPRTETADGWNNAKSDWIFFFGSDVCAEGIAVLEEMRGKIPADYGRDRGIAWYALLGFGLSHPDAANARVIKWDSAA